MTIILYTSVAEVKINEAIRLRLSIRIAMTEDKEWEVVDLVDYVGRFLVNKILNSALSNAMDSFLIVILCVLFTFRFSAKLTAQRIALDSSIFRSQSRNIFNRFRL